MAALIEVTYSATLRTMAESLAERRLNSAGFNSTLQSVRMIIQPLLLASPAVLLWHCLYICGLHSTAAADEPIVNAILPALASMHVFIAGFIFLREAGDIRELRKAIRTGDKEKFLEIAEDKIPIPLRYVLFVSATMIECWTMSLNYDLYWTGFFSVYSIGYMLTLIWEIIADFDDPIHGIWVVKGVPEDWIRDANIKRRLSDRFYEWLFAKIQHAR